MNTKQKTLKIAKNNKSDKLYKKETLKNKINSIPVKKLNSNNYLKKHFKIIKEDRDEFLLSSQSTRDKVLETLKSDENNYFDNLLKKDDIEIDGNNISQSFNIPKYNKSSHSRSHLYLNCGSFKNMQNNSGNLIQNLNKLSESTNSNFLNFNLGQSKNFTFMNGMYDEKEEEKEEELKFDSIKSNHNRTPTKLTNTKKEINLKMIELEIDKFDENNSVSSQFYSDDNSCKYEEKKEIKSLNSNLSISKISYLNLSSSKLISNINLFIRSNKNVRKQNPFKKEINENIQNISILTEGFSIFYEIEKEYDSSSDNLDNSDYCPDTEEFNNNSYHHNVPYYLKTNKNYLESHLDILNLNFILRCIFHKSEILNEVILTLFI